MRQSNVTIQRSAWKGYSPKFASKIVHRTPPESREDGFWGTSRHARGNYMLWWCIKIREYE
jgi:hypothetical protein